MSMSESFLVIVRCMTFNHYAYIEDAMNGFCMQKTDFPYLCIVMDDCSTDGEQEVIKNYVSEHFNSITNEETDDYVLNLCQHKTNENCIFAVFYLKYNHYSIKKSKITYYSRWQDKCKYIAFCEGDDYWIDEKKLQMQTDFLEENVEYGMCYTRAKVYNQEKESLTSTLLGKDYISFIDLLKTNCIPTLTVIIRTNLYLNYIKDVKPEQENWLMGDYPMWLWFSKNSQIKYYQYITSVYRLLQNSASHSLDTKKEIAFINSTYKIKQWFAEKYHLSVSEWLLKKEFFDFFWIKYCHSTNDIYYQELQRFSVERKSVNFKYRLKLFLILNKKLLNVFVSIKYRNKKKN